MWPWRATLTTLDFTPSKTGGCPEEARAVLGTAGGSFNNPERAWFRPRWQSEKDVRTGWM